MAKAWKDVIASEQYQALAPEQKAQAQEQYFNEVVAPQAGQNAEQARQAFYNAYPVSQPQAAQQDQPQEDKSLMQRAGDWLTGGQGAGQILEQAGRGLVNIPFDALQAGASTINAVSQAVGGPKVLDDVYRPVDRPTDKYAQTGETIGNYLTPGLGVGGNMIAGSLSEAANQQGDFAQNATQNAALNAVIGGATNLVGRGIGAAYRGVKGAISPEAQQAIRFAEQEGVPLHTSDVLPPTSRTGKMAQSTAENIPLAGTSRMRANQQEARSQLVDDFASRFGEYDPSILVGSAKARTAGVKQAAGNRLQKVQDAMNGVSIQPNRAIQQIDEEISKLQGLGKVADTDTIGKLQAYRDELTSNVGSGGPVNMDLQRLSNLRSQFRQDVKGERMVMPDRSNAAIQRVYNAMTGDIDNAISQNLGSETLVKYKQANAVYASEADKIKNTRLKNVLMKGDLTPEVVNNMLFSKNRSEVQNLYNSVGNVGRAQMRNGIIGKAMERSNGSPDQFLRQVNQMSNQTGITFKGQDAAYLKGLTNYLQSTQQAAKAGVTTPTGQQTIPFIIGYGTAANPITTGAAVSYGLLSRAYESAPFRNAMLRMANTPRGSTAFEKALAQANKAATAIAEGSKPSPE